jgi:hypothetical protein
METWTWLEREGLIALTPDTDADAVFVTRSLSRYEKWSGGSIHIFRAVAAECRKLEYGGVGRKTVNDF